MRLCWHPDRRLELRMTVQFGPVQVAWCPDCPAVEFGLYCVPELQTPWALSEEEHDQPEP